MQESSGSQNGRTLDLRRNRDFLLIRTDALCEPINWAATGYTRATTPHIDDAGSSVAVFDHGNAPPPHNSYWSPR